MGFPKSAAPVYQVIRVAHCATCFVSPPRDPLSCSFGGQYDRFYHEAMIPAADAESEVEAMMSKV